MSAVSFSLPPAAPAGGTADVVGGFLSLPRAATAQAAEVAALRQWVRREAREVRMGGGEGGWRSWGGHTRCTRIDTATTAHLTWWSLQEERETDYKTQREVEGERVEVRRVLGVCLSGSVPRAVGHSQ